VRSATRFVRDLAHSELLAEAAYHLDGSQWIGDWHTHLGGPARLSHIDLGSYRSVLNNSDLNLFLAIIALPGATSWQRPRLSCWAVSAKRVDPLALFDPLGP
jgi:proteasome lid subunit RPN8/RPN11